MDNRTIEQVRDNETRWINEANNLQQRVDKAIEFIKNEQLDTDIDEVINTDKLINILKGEE